VTVDSPLKYHLSTESLLETLTSHWKLTLSGPVSHWKSSAVGLQKYLLHSFTCEILTFSQTFDHINPTERLAIKITLFCYETGPLNTYINITSSSANKKGCVE